MRFHRHDFRDMSLAFGLAFDTRRITQAGVALSWTLLVLVGAGAVLSWRATGEVLSPEGIYVAVVSISDSAWTPLQLLLFAAMAAAWWAGFAYLCAPIQRSAALDIARDERERNPSIPMLNRQAAFGPLLAGLVGAAGIIVLLLWSLLTYIPGTVGAGIATVTLPVALLVALPAAAFCVVAVPAAPMMGPTAVVEGRDYLEAVSRPMSYVIQRPGRYLMYWLAKLGVMGASALLGIAVLALTWGMVALSLWAVGQQELLVETTQQALANPDVTGSELAMGLSVVFWGSVFMLLAWLAVIGLSCDMIIYLLMRYRVDGITFDKIAVAEEALARVKTAVETAEQAEESRKRFDEQQGAAESA